MQLNPAKAGQMKRLARCTVSQRHQGFKVGVARKVWLRRRHRLHRLVQWRRRKFHRDTARTKGRRKPPWMMGN